jgi:hypothetical protein
VVFFELTLFVSVKTPLIASVEWLRFVFVQIREHEGGVFGVLFGKTAHKCTIISSGFAENKVITGIVPRIFARFRSPSSRNLFLRAYWYT